MQLLGSIGRRKAFHLSPLNHPNWEKSLPKGPWLAFIYVDAVQEESIPPVLRSCLDSGVGYVCTAGPMAHWADLYLDEEIAWRGVQDEFYRGPVSTHHTVWETGFWYASCTANGEEGEIEAVVCVDISYTSIRPSLALLVTRINAGWTPQA